MTQPGVDRQKETPSQKEEQDCCGAVVSGARVKRELFVSGEGPVSTRQLTMAVPGQVPGAGRTGSGIGCSVVPADVHIKGPVTGEAWGGRGGQMSGGPSVPLAQCFSAFHTQALPQPRPPGVVGSLLRHSSSHQTPRPRPPSEPCSGLLPPSKFPPQMLPTL